MGRWHSSLVVHYAGDSMALGLTDELSKNKSDASTAEPSTVTALADKITALTARLDEIITEDRAVRQRVEALGLQDRRPDFVLNMLTNSLHRSIDLYNPISTHVRTVCGWRYVGMPHQMLRQAPPNHPWRKVCEKKLLDLRNEHRAVQCKASHDEDSSQS